MYDIYGISGCKRMEVWVFICCWHVCLALCNGGTACDLQYFMAEKKTGKQDGALWTCIGSGFSVFDQWMPFASSAFDDLFVDFWRFSFAHLCGVHAKNVRLS